MRKALVKSSLKQLGWYERASRIWIRLEPLLVTSTRALTGRNQRLTARYLATHARPALHIGCGDNELRGWLNTELCPRGGQIYLNAAKPFPFDAGVFSFIYSEHMIEHISAADAEAMLGECFRVMAAGAVLRLVTPNLAFLLRLLEPQPAPEISAYLRYCISAHRVPAAVADGVGVFNTFMREWGHQFIHTERSLRTLLERARFIDIRSCPLSESAHPQLTGLAKVDRMPDGFLSMESFTLEARKPDPRV